MDERGDGEVRTRRERGHPDLTLNANDEYLRKFEARRRETDGLPEDELALEITKQRDRSRRDAGGMPFAGG